MHRPSSSKSAALPPQTELQLGPSTTVAGINVAPLLSSHILVRVAINAWYTVVRRTPWQSRRQPQQLQQHVDNKDAFYQVQPFE